MLTEEYIKYIDALSIYQGKALLQRQHTIATGLYQERTGSLRRATSARVESSRGIMRIEYPLHIRMLDLKKTATGRKKRVYEPIYNKYVYGFLYIGIYKALVKGISGKVRASLFKHISNELN